MTSITYNLTTKEQLLVPMQDISPTISNVKGNGQKYLEKPTGENILATVDAKNVTWDLKSLKEQVPVPAKENNNTIHEPKECTQMKKESITKEPREIRGKDGNGNKKTSNRKLEGILLNNNTGIPLLESCTIETVPPSISICERHISLPLVTVGKFRGYYDDRKLRCRYCRVGITVSGCSCQNFSIVPSPLSQLLYDRDKNGSYNNRYNSGRKGNGLKKKNRQKKKKTKNKKRNSKVHELEFFSSDDDEDNSECEESSLLYSNKGRQKRFFFVNANRRLLTNFTDRYNEMSIGVFLSYQDLNRKMRFLRKNEPENDQKYIEKEESTQYQKESI